MLNRLGSIHCGFCGHLLTDTSEAHAADAGFKVPKLRPEDSGEDDLETPAPPDVSAQRQTILGLPAEELVSRAPVSARTIVGMPAVQLEPSALPQGVAEARAAALRKRVSEAGAERPGAPPPPIPSSPAARVVVAGEATDALADTPPPEGEDAPPPARTRPPSQTLFGMRAAELHLGIGESDTADVPVAERGSGGPAARGFFDDDVDDDELGFLDESDGDDDTLEPPKREQPFARRTSSARIDAVAPLRGEGEAFADTAVIKAVDPEAPAMRDAIEKAQQAYAEKHGLPPAGSVPPSAQEGQPTLPGTPSALGMAPVPRTGAAAAASSLTSAAAGAPYRKWRGLGAGLVLLATFLPFSASTWSRVDLFADLGPVLVGVLGLVVVAQRAVPRWLLLAVGGLALVVGVFQFLGVGVPGSGTGAGMLVRFFLVVGGAILLGVTSLGAVARPPTRPDQPPPSQPG